MQCVYDLDKSNLKKVNKSAHTISSTLVDIYTALAKRGDSNPIDYAAMYFFCETKDRRGNKVLAL